jgi:hypothetical protein
LIYNYSGSDTKIGGKFYGFEINNSKKGKSGVVKFPFDATMDVNRVYSYVKSLTVSLPLFASSEMI